MLARIRLRPDLFNILTNTGWLFGDRIIRLGIGVLVGVWVARYLGPDQFGLMSYALAFISLFATVAGLGLNGIVTRDLVREPQDAARTLSTAFVMQLAGSLLAFSLAVTAIRFVRPDDELAGLLVAVLGLVMLLKTTDIVKCWFESQVRSKYSVWVESGSFLTIAAVKVGLILAGASLLTFVWAIFAEALLVSAGLLIVASRHGIALSVRSARYGRAKTLLKDSWPLILSGLAIMIYMRIDQIMLGIMRGDQDVGIYSAALRISEVWYFIPTAIVASVFPAIIETKRQSDALYKRRMQKLYQLMVRLAVAIAIPMTFLSDRIVELLFGRTYAEAGIVLAIHIWAGVFVFLGVASGQWLLLENLQIHAFYRAFTGAAINIGMNLALIPKYGPVGAALGTIVSQASAAYFFDFLNSRTRDMFWMKTKALVLIYRPGTH